MTTSKSKPSHLPSPETDTSESAAVSSSGQSKPEELSSAEMALMSTSTSAAAEPGLEPPAALTGQQGGITASVWQKDKRFSSLWTINQDRNAWVYVVNIGWKKLSTASASGSVALNMLSAHGKQLNKRVEYREEDDGMIHEIYVW